MGDENTPAPATEAVAPPPDSTVARPQVMESPPESSAEVQEEEATNLQPILDTVLDLKLRFGQRIMTLRDVVDLSAGSIIELEKKVHDPAEILLDDRIIARGEIVLSEGSYALRVTEIGEAQRRLPVSPEGGSR